MATPLMPAAFLGHGSPMNAIERNRYTEAWRAFGASVPRPRAIIAVSAHWHVNALVVTAMSQPRTIHDFFGFPKALFDVRYPAPGLPELAEEVADAVSPDRVGFDLDAWGIDHGTWGVLVHAFPDADIPVLQLSINALRPLDYHVDLARRLAPLRQRSVMVLASGNVVHNLRRLQWNEAELAYDWAERFDDAVAGQLSDDPANILKVMEQPDYDLAVPTPDHFVPLLYIAGLAAADNARPEPLLRGYAMGSISMTCYGLEADIELRKNPCCAARLPAGVPPEQTNM